MPSLPTNPVLPGFYPDPSVCRVGSDYYLATSSFEYFPGVPLFHSRDLLNWRQLGHCLSHASQLPLEGAASSKGIYAPTLRYHHGRFYLITTNLSAGGHFYVSSADPVGPWSAPTWLGSGGIDPSLLFDRDGTVYFTRTSGSAIVQSVLDLATGRELSAPQPVWNGTGRQYAEGPHLYQIGPWYYLLLAEGGTGSTHMATLARSRSPWGPFEPCPHNPILTHAGYASPFQAIGHADLVEDHQGRWWLLCLGVRPSPHGEWHHLGRETFLAPVKWDAAGWPLVGCAGRVPYELSDTLPLQPQPTLAARDDFDRPILALEWNFRRNPCLEHWSLAERPGWLRLACAAATLDDCAPVAFVGRRQQHPRCQATALLEFEPVCEGEEAGLTVLMNEAHHYELAVGWVDGQRTVLVRRRIGTLSAVVARAPSAPGALTLQVTADWDWYTFSYAVGAEPAHILARGETRYLSSEVAGGFTGVYLGMYATGSGVERTTAAWFDWFTYQPSSP